MELKVVSWNIWIDGHLDKWKEFLSATDADIIGLQEVKDDDPERDVIGFLTGLGYHHVFAPMEKEWDGRRFRFGSAIFSKFPIVQSERFVIDENDKRAVAQADINVNGTIVHAFSTHLKHTHQEPSEIQEAQVAKLIEKLPAERTIVMGDFNATPESATIKKMSSVLKNTDSTSAPTLSMHPPICPKCNPPADTKLDYIFVTPDIQFHSFKVGDSKGSDHLPISVQVEI